MGSPRESQQTLVRFSRCVRLHVPSEFLGTAGAGTLILEFGTLSRLTGDDRFEKAAYKAFFALWNRRSDIGLVGNTVNTWSGVCALLIFLLTRYIDCYLVMVAPGSQWGWCRDRLIL